MHSLNFRCPLPGGRLLKISFRKLLVRRLHVFLLGLLLAERRIVVVNPFGLRRRQHFSHQRRRDSEPLVEIWIRDLEPLLQCLQSLVLIPLGLHGCYASHFQLRFTL